jgi:pimeloyl-ACP methyl ester carboxylesterase
VAAPYTRGYAPSAIPADGSYHAAALMYDALQLHQALSGDERAVLIGHDWGALTANGIAAYDGSPYARVVAMAVPPIPAMNPRRGELGRWARILPRQATMSWYTLFNQLPRLPEENFDRLAAHLWRRWAPGYDASEDLAHLAAALPDRAHKAAAIGYYRAQPRYRQIPRQYAHLADAWLGEPRVPLLYLHGADDGCLDRRWVTHVQARLEAPSRAALIPGAGHFLQLERPEVVADRVAEFLAEA